MQYRVWLESLEEVSRKKITAPIGSEYKEQIVEVKSEKMHDEDMMAYFIITTFAEGKSGRILVADYPDQTKGFMGGLIWTEIDMPFAKTIVAFSMDKLMANFVNPSLAKVAKEIGVKYALRELSILEEQQFATKYGFGSLAKG